MNRADKLSCGILFWIIVYFGSNAWAQMPPVVLPINDTSVVEGQTLRIPVHTSDTDSIPPILRATNLPTNATFNDTITGTKRTGKFSFTPDYSQAGNYLVYFQVVDSLDNGLTAMDSVKITVRNVNQAPRFTRRISNRIINEGVTLVDSIMAVDDDGPIPILRMTTVLRNSTFLDRGNGTGIFTFTPDYTQGNQNPNSYPLSFVAIDSQDTMVTTNYQPTTTISVMDVPIPPVIRPINDTSVVEGGALSFYVYASDPDSTIPTLSAFNLPTNSTFAIIGGSLGRFSFNPNFCQAGIYTVGFVARDNTSLADTVLVRITVNDAGNHKPSLTPISDKVAAAGDLLSFTVNATDPDCTIPQLLADSSLPRNAVFHDSTNGKGLFRFTPDSTQIDSIYSVIFIASDGSLADSARVHISVIAYVRGDANRDGKVTVADVVYLVSYLFKGGPAPVPLGAGDANHDGKITVGDCVYLINFLFKGGPPP